MIMNNMYVCNGKNNSISKINIEDMSFEKLYLGMNGRFNSPKDIEIEGEVLVVANGYENTISVLNMDEFKEIYCDYIGAKPVDAEIYENYAYILCNESNSILLYDLKNRRTILTIPSGNCPQNIAMDKERKKLFVTNLLDNSVSIIDMKENVNIDSIHTEKYPLRVKISKDKQFFFILESSLEENGEDYISIYKLDDFSLVKRLKSGYIPIDIYEDTDYFYILNIGDGTINKIDLKNKLEGQTISIGGIPDKIEKNNNSFFITDCSNKKVYVLDESLKKQKIITLGI
ncbi:hypothetical protein GPK36_12265 [Clostridium baratii]|nr:hypothetical protein [Clostridium baratii]